MSHAESKIEQRLAALEQEVVRIKLQLQIGRSNEAWLDTVWGAFSNDPAFLEAMRYGQQWRKSSRPKPSRRRK